MEFDKIFIEELKTGKIKAFEKLLSLTEKGIFSYLYGLVGQKEDAEDLTQKTFFKVYKNLESIDPEKSLKAWIYKIATNTAYDWLRHKKITPELMIIDDEENAAETIEADDSYLKLEDSMDIGAALEKLKPVHKNVISLYYYEGLSYEEIAGAMSLPINTVKTHIRRAKLELKKLLTIN